MMKKNENISHIRRMKKGVLSNLPFYIDLAVASLSQRKYLIKRFYSLTIQKYLVFIVIKDFLNLYNNNYRNNYKFLKMNFLSAS